MEQEEALKPTRMEKMVAEHTAKKLYELQQKKKKSKDKQFIKLKLSRGMMKQNYVCLILLKTNGVLLLKKLKIQNGGVYLPENKTFHRAEGDHIYSYKGKIPTIILPEFSVNPISKQDIKDYQEFGAVGRLQKKAKDEKATTDGQRFIMKKAEEYAVGIKHSKGVGSKTVIYVILGIIVAYIISLIAGRPLI